jgi:uncharacterized protein YdeI (YjbR/CyaY-like superfamily)
MHVCLFIRRPKAKADSVKIDDMPKAEHKGEPILQFADVEPWETWLEENHAASTGVWLKIGKKHVGPSTVTHAEALESAICFGWIDAQRDKLDERHFLQRFTGRRNRSNWSRVNRTKALELIEQGRMRSAGHAQIEAAKADGRWQAAYAPQSQREVPEDLQAALDANPEAKAFFETLRGTRRYAFTYRLSTVKRPETRTKRIASYIELLSAGKTLHD